MNHSQSRAVCFKLSVFVFVCAVIPVLAVDYRKPAEVKQLIEQIIRQPQPQPAEVASFYADGVGHFDGFIPTGSFMQTNPPAKAHYKFTYHDGRVVKCEYVEASGKVASYFPVWNNNNGAPILTGYFRAGGSCDWYMYAEYNASGKIQTIYRFNSSFELQFYQEFIYEGTATRIRDITADGAPRSETLYENGEVFVITDGEKRKVNDVDRTDAIRAPVKFGMKPIYPGY